MGDVPNPRLVIVWPRNQFLGMPPLAAMAETIGHWALYNLFSPPLKTSILPYFLSFLSLPNQNNAYLFDWPDQIIPLIQMYSFGMSPTCYHDHHCLL
jgi:hypothetical protein